MSKFVKGALWMIASGMCFVAVAVTVRWVGPEIPAAQASFIRYLFGTLIMLPSLVIMMRAPKSFGSLRLLTVRSALHALGVLLWFYAMARIPMQEVTALGYITPILVTIGAAVFLGERLQMRRIMAVGIGFIGVLIILRPGFQSISSGQIALLFSSPLFAVSFLIAKKLTQVHQSTTIIAILSLVCTICLAIPAMLQWVNIEPVQWAMLFLTAAFATLGHFAMTAAFRCAPIAALQPFSFLQLVWATALGAAIFQDKIDIYVLIGGAVLVLSVSYVAHREAVLAGKSKV